MKRAHVRDLGEAVALIERFEVDHRLRITPYNDVEVDRGSPLYSSDTVTDDGIKVLTGQSGADVIALPWRAETNAYKEGVNGVREVFIQWAFDEGHIIERELLTRAVIVLIDARRRNPSA